MEDKRNKFKSHSKWNQIVTEGKLIAEVELDGEKIKVFIPEEEKEELVVRSEDHVTSERKEQVANISINGVEIPIYIPKSNWNLYNSIAIGALAIVEIISFFV